MVASCCSLSSTARCWRKRGSNFHDRLEDHAPTRCPWLNTKLSCRRETTTRSSTLLRRRASFDVFGCLCLLVCFTCEYDYRNTVRPTLIIMKLSDRLTDHCFYWFWTKLGSKSNPSDKPNKCGKLLSSSDIWRTLLHSQCRWIAANAMTSTDTWRVKSEVCHVMH